MNLRSLLRGCAALSLWAGASLCLQAAPITFYLDESGQITSSSSGTGNHITYTDLGSGFSVTATAWYAPAADGDLAKAKLARYSGGLGVCADGERCGSPNHAVDNSGGKDFVLFSFSGLANPERLRIGWSSNDADVQYWVGSILSPDLDGVNIADLGTQGFTAYNINEGDGSRTFDLLGGDGFALLVSGELSEHNDYFKIEKLKVDYCPPEEPQVPEPATMGLVGVSIAGLAIYRRRRNG